MILHQNHHSNKGKSISIFVGAKCIGKVTGDTFYKTIREGLYLRTPPAIAFDVSSLDDAERVKAEWVDIRDTDSGKHYRAKIALIRSAGFPVNRRFGVQIGLSLSYFSVDGQPPTNTPPAPPHAPGPEQYRLF
jgi:hypothetical protein